MSTVAKESKSPVAERTEPRKLHRAVGFYGLTFVSLGSIIGSGWLLGALKAAQVAGPASIISWVLAAAMLSVLALIHAELGAAYPVAGGTARFPIFAFGPLVGFVAGWAAWLQAVAIAPIEVEASLAYLNNIKWVKDHLNLLHSNETLTASGFGWATLLMVLFTTVNLVGVKFMAESNVVAVLWKTAVPILAIGVLISVSFHPANFHAGGGFAPYGAHGIFAALPVGVVFALQGFEQAIQLGGEARNPQRDISRAVITAMAIGVVLYIMLEITFVGGLDPANLVHGWKHPIAAGDFGPYATIASAAGAGWLAYVLYVDAFISPAGTGLIYVAASARLSYALGRDRQLPTVLSKINKRGVPFWSVGLAFTIGEISFLPFPSWQSLVAVVTSATAMMYGFAPVALAALRRRDPQRVRPYRLPCARVLAPTGFVAANLIVYWSGFHVTWKLVLAIALGLGLFSLTYRLTSRGSRPKLELRSAQWIAPWLLGLLAIGFAGRYGHGAQNWLPEWIDLVVVVVFGLAIFYWAVSVAMKPAEVVTSVEREKLELAVEPSLAV